VGIEHIRMLKEQAKLPKQKIKKPIAKKSAKKIAREKEEKELAKVTPSGGAELKRWFADRRKEMTGRCKHCSGVTTKDNDQYFRHSIAHILPKRIFHSVATNPHNWVELCYFGNSCHANVDNNMLDLMDLNCFDEVIEKFIAMYPDIAKEERKYIPDVLLQYLPIDLK